LNDSWGLEKRKIKDELDLTCPKHFSNRNLAIESRAIHGRNREYLPPNRLRRPWGKGWELDWFG